MNELLRFTATGQNGVLVFLPPKFEFVFYEQKMEMYKKGKLERTINSYLLLKYSKVSISDSVNSL